MIGKPSFYVSYTHTHTHSLSHTQLHYTPETASFSVQMADRAYSFKMDNQDTAAALCEELEACIKAARVIF
jgi:hypothetical protein